MSDVSQHLSSMSALKLALVAQQHATTRELLKAEPIAIIGVGCRFPNGADTPERFWQLLRNGVDAVREVPNERWNIDAFYDPDPAAPGKIYTRYASFLDQVDEFDPAFFGISPREAVMMDPQQRILLEVSWESLERAGIAPTTLQGTPTGVFIGMMAQDYAHLSANALEPIDAYTGTGNLMSVAAGRLAYVLGCHGPTLTVDTACSSSLVTVHLACQSLRQAECDMALAGGVNVLLTPHHSVMQSRAHMLSPDGRCKAFDAAADGMSRGEGCGIVVLKRLADAVANGDHVLAVIRGSAVNHDGRSSGLTVPNGRAQEQVIRQALESGGVNPTQVSYVEAHGSGTALGDPIEVEALTAVYGRNRQTPLVIGSVKTNVGHLESAAGIAGLIKVVLALQHQEIPPHLHFRQPNPHIAWSASLIMVPTEQQPWPTGSQRVAGVSSFGASGTNAHVVLEEAPVLAAPKPDRGAVEERPLHVVGLSAKTAAGLTALAQRYEEYLADNLDVSLTDISFTANTGRSHFQHRLSVVAESPSDFRQKLATFNAGKSTDGVSTGQISQTKPKIAFLFTGQGAQYVGMGRQLYATHQVFREVIDRCDATLQHYLEQPLLDVLYRHGSENGGSEHPSPIDETAYAQPALFALEYALATLWQSWGVKPDIVMGHSIGEYVAACVAGAFSLEDGLKLIAARGRLIQSVSSGGATAAVFATADRVADLIASQAGSVSVAAVNGPEETLIAGVADHVETVLKALSALGITSRRLRISHAPHSPLVEPALHEFERLAREVTYHPPRIKLISNVTGELIRHVDAAYWQRHMREPVQFASGMKQLEAENCEVMLEIGPQPVLLWLGRQNWTGSRQVSWLASLWGIRSDWEQLLQSVGELYVRGVDLDWASFHRDDVRRKVVLPTYPFQRQRYWVRTPAAAWHPVGQHEHDPNTHALLGRRSRSAAFTQNEIQFETRISANDPAYLGDHCVYEHAVLPATAYLEMALKAGANILTTDHVALENVVIHQALVLPKDDAGLNLQCILTPYKQGFTWHIYAAEAEGDYAPWTLYAEGIIPPPKSLSPEQVDCTAIQTEITTAVEVEAFYQTFQQRHVHYGPHFRLLRQLWRAPGRALGLVRLSEDLVQETTMYHLHPVLLDACFQVSAATLSDEPVTYLPIGVERLETIGRPGTELWCEARLRSAHPEAPIIDLRLWTADGQLVANVKGLQLKRASVQTIRGEEPWQNWLYQVVWQPQGRLSAAETYAQGRNVALPSISGGDVLARVDSTNAATMPCWLIFADGMERGRQLAMQLRSNHATSTLIFPGGRYEQVDTHTFRIDPTSIADYRTLFSAFPDVHVVIYGWSVENSVGRSTEDTAEILQTTSVAGCASLLSLVQAMVDLAKPPKLWVVTQGAVACAGSQPAVPHLTAAGVAQSPVWGMAKVIALEHPELRCVCVDLDPDADTPETVQMLLEELTAPQSGPVEDQVAFRHRARYVARLARMAKTQGNTPVSLAITARGSVENLTLQPLQRRLPKADEVEIRVRATGLNFRDVLNVLGMYPGDPGSVGNECAGEVVAIGDTVESFAVGDQVVALVDEGFSHYVTVAANRVVHKPRELSFEEAATIPIAFLTAACCLDHMAHIQPGERVLIHTATGGFGQAAIQLAQSAGADIFATASREKWKTLQDLGVKHIYDSRTLDFAADVMTDTAGEGVDVVLNTLTGPGFIEKNLATLAPNGRFVEVSKRDVWNAERIASVRPDVAYFLVDLAEMTAKQPDVVQTMLQELMPAFAERTLLPLPRTRFPLSDVVGAFRYMLQAKHTGKIVVTPPETRETGIREDGTYLITGGLGGLGLLMARWLVESGATHLLLLGRRPPQAQIQRQLDELARLGAEVTVVQADVADTEQVTSVLASIDQAYPLRGIIHAAGVLNDGALVNQDVARFAQVFAPKVQGGWNLHTLTKDLPVDFFVLFSSVASVLGSAGQASHAAANAFLDALAHYRRALGLPALAINWGAWSEVGQAAPFVPQMQRSGLGAISPQQGQHLMEELLTAPCAQAGVIPIDWSRYSADRPLLTGFRQAGASQRQQTLTFMEELEATPVDRRQQRLVEHIQTAVARILGHRDGDAISISQGFRELGMDSLTSLELRNRLQTSLDCQLPAGVVFNYPTVEAVAQYLAEHVVSARIPGAIVPAEEPVQQPSHPRPEQKAISGAAVAPLPMRERRLDGRDLSLCVCDWGADDGLPIVCLHGTMDHGPSWEAVAQTLVADGYKVMAPDLRGHGRSGHLGAHGSYHVRDFVGDLDVVLRQLGTDSVPLVAHSFGSMIAVIYAAARPERISALVLVEPPLPPKHPQPQTFAAQIAAHLSDPDTTPQHVVMPDLSVAVERLCQVTPAMPQALALRMAKRLTTVQEGGIVWRWDARLDAPHERLFAGLAREEYLSMLASIRVPITIIYGAASGWITPEDKHLIQAALPQTRPIVLHGGHNLQVDAAADLAAVINHAVKGNATVAQSSSLTWG
jgi:myxalamid-type polyketide synthase MxaB